MKLKSRTGNFPPGSYKFVDPKTGMKFDVGNFDFVVQAIRKHRLANPSVYPPNELAALDAEQVGIELENYTCNRLGNNPVWCEDGVYKPPVQQGAKQVTMEKPCVQCGESAGTERLCQTCAGRRVVGVTCNKCGFIVSF